MFNPRAFENSGPEGHGVLEIAGRRGVYVPLRESELSGTIAGPLATLRLVQRFEGSPEPGAAPIEALYRFPLPGDAAVLGVIVRFGEAEIVTKLAPRAAAEQEYAEARDSGRQGALVTREASGVFTLHLTGVRAGEAVSVETTYVQLAAAEGPGWSLRVPLTTAPRYTRGDETGTHGADAQPLAVRRDPGHRFRLDLRLVGAGAAVASLALDTATEADGLRVRLRDGAVAPDRDLVLGWRPAQAPDHATLTVVREDDASGQAYFLARVAPPADPGAVKPAPRDVVLLVDHSGSMEGAKWAAADWATQAFLRGLGPDDTFAFGLFENTTYWFKETPVAATTENVEAAIAYLHLAHPWGGTELGVALEQAFALPRAAGQRARHVLVVTDAEVTDEGRLLRLAEREAARGADSRRLSLVCIDAAPNSYLVNAMADAGRGVARYLTSDPAEADVTTALDALLEDWNAPLHVGLRLVVDAADARAAGRQAVAEGGRTAIDLGDLPAGRSIWVVGRVPDAAGKLLAFTLAGGGLVQELAAEGAPLPAGEAGAALRASFGARQLAGLEHLMASGRQGAALADALAQLGYRRLASELAGGEDAVYHENATRDARRKLVETLVAESLYYGLPTTETAFVATRREKGAPVGETMVVANALPSGWGEGFIGGGGPGVARMMAMPAPGPGGAPRAKKAKRPQAFSPPPAPEMEASMAYEADEAELYEGGAYDLASSGAMAPAEAEPPLAQPGVPAVYAGTPDLSGGEAVLYETTSARRLTLLTLAFPGGAPASLDPGLVLELYVDDPTAPRARVKLADLVRAGGSRPLNVAPPAGARVWLRLVDAAGAWKAGAPALAIGLG